MASFEASCLQSHLSIREKNQLHSFAEIDLPFIVGPGRNKVLAPGPFYSVNGRFLHFCG
jgi:hypothetical protein